MKVFLRVCLQPRAAQRKRKKNVAARSDENVQRKTRVRKTFAGPGTRNPISGRPDFPLGIPIKIDGLGTHLEALLSGPDGPRKAQDKRK